MERTKVTVEQQPRKRENEIFSFFSDLKLLLLIPLILYCTKRVTELQRKRKRRGKGKRNFSSKKKVLQLIKEAGGRGLLVDIEVSP